MAARLPASPHGGTEGRMEGEEEKERRDMILIPEKEGGVRRGYSGVKIYLDTI